jgi:spore germination protein GerM
VVIVLIIVGCKTSDFGRIAKQEIQQGTKSSLPKRQIVIYFADKAGRFLVPETREVGNSSLPEAAISALIVGPRGKNNRPTIPAETILLDLELTGDTALVNFSKSFIEDRKKLGISPILSIYSVVNTLTELKGIRKVRFLVEGKTLATIEGKIDLSEPIPREISLIHR